ncbi:DUF3825 domain-containing protein [Caproiciproducens galactitolivorans]|uniref:DUF3825 domain-containing protein n=1 Tax=Caproiciproducens galactitolivorans TaxID=642589 RepID=A0ABT4BUG7_9FIRM|nr:DUF3825 domain-containing protein [Caproiciproducens galactitolivorans]MCY1713723.1 DUF3825 domain-containing protein [Caproiciproducens galactitolivorans]
MKLFDFALCVNFNNKIQALSQLCPENWGETKYSYTGHPINNPVLHNYIKHVFSKTYEDYENVSDPNDQKSILNIKEDKYCVFNTGLYDQNFQSIYAYFVPISRPSKDLKWFLDGFYTQYSLSILGVDVFPKKANFFKNSNDFVFNFDYTIIPQYEHIFGDEENIKRIPETVRNSQRRIALFNGALDEARKRIDANYKTAVPQYFNGKIQLLIPIYLTNLNEPDLALVVTKDEENKHYLGHTCLTMDMAYNNARLIARPDSEWLRP